METQDAPLLLTTQELMRKARISKSTALRWRRDGIGPKPIRLDSRMIRYRADEVDEFLGLRSTSESA